MVRLAVLPEYRHCDYGRQLVEFIECEAEGHGFSRIDIALVGENRKLKEWYRKLGYVENGTRQYDHLPFTVAFMHKEAFHG